VKLPAQWGLVRVPQSRRTETEADDGAVIVRVREGRARWTFEANFGTRAEAEDALWDVSLYSRDVLLALDDTDPTHLQRRLAYGYLDVSQIVDETVNYYLARAEIEALP
jgi:hypothetical protein